MQPYLEAQEYTAPDLEAVLIAAVRAAPELYWEALDLLPTCAANAFTVNADAWEELARAIEANNPLPTVDGQAAPAPDPLAAARTLGEFYQKRSLAQLHQDALQSLRDGVHLTVGIV